MASARFVVASTSSHASVIKPAKLNTGRVAVMKLRAAAPAAEAWAAAGSRPAEYAVISTPTGQQLVEEGKWFALCSESAIKASSEDGQLRFPVVAVKRTDGEFVKGQRANGWVVEAELIDEQAFALQSGGGSGSSGFLGKVLVTKILHTEETRRRIEEAFMV